MLPELAVKRRRNIHRGTNRGAFHEDIISHAINMALFASVTSGLSAFVSNNLTMRRKATLPERSFIGPESSSPSESACLGAR